MTKPSSTNYPNASGEVELLLTLPKGGEAELSLTSPPRQDDTLCARFYPPLAAEAERGHHLLFFPILSSNGINTFRPAPFEQVARRARETQKVIPKVRDGGRKSRSKKSHMILR